MPQYSFDWVDAFTTQAFGGNGCAVVHDAAELEPETCCKLVRETSLVECTFIGPSKVADFRVRYFLASQEIPFAGHPTIASVVSLVDRGLVSAGQITLETGAGIIDIAIDQSSEPGPVITMTQNAPVFGELVPARIVAAVVGVNVDDIVGTPQIVSTGLPFTITVLKDLDALRRAKLNLSNLTAYRTEFLHPEVGLMEPYLLVQEGATEAGDTMSRLLLEPPNPPEDPFTGSATGCAAAYLWHHQMIDVQSYVAEQGHWMGRPGQARVEIMGLPENITGIKVSGQGHILMRGHLLI